MKIDPRLFPAMGSLMMVLLVAACVRTDGSASNPNTPGATGQTIVPGSSSTIAGDAQATSEQQKWPLGRGR